MPSRLKNKILRGCEESVEAGLTPRNRDNYYKIVNAGLQIGIHDGNKGVLAAFGDSKDPISDAALGAVNLCQILKMESQGTMPDQAMAPAAYVLMLNALDFAEGIGVVEVDMAALVRATHIYTNQMFKVNNISPEQLIKMSQQTYDAIENPAKLEIIKRRAGTVRDPRASIPVELDVAAIAPRNRAERRRQGRR